MKTNSKKLNTKLIKQLPAGGVSRGRKIWMVFAILIQLFVFSGMSGAAEWNNPPVSWASTNGMSAVDRAIRQKSVARMVHLRWIEDTRVLGKLIIRTIKGILKMAGCKIDQQGFVVCSTGQTSYAMNFESAELLVSMKMEPTDRLTFIEDTYCQVQYDFSGRPMRKNCHFGRSK